VPLLGRPFLAYQLALLREHGVTDIILACSYRVDDVRQALGDGRRLGVRLRYVIETEPLGTGGGVRNAADLARGTVFVLNGDVLTDADLTAMRQFHETRRSRTTIFLMPVPDPRAFGLVELDAGGRLTRFREKPTADEPITTNTINAGIYLIDGALLDRIPTDRPVSIEREFFPALITDGIAAYGWTGQAYWRDIGSTAAYREAQIDLLNGRVRSPLTPPGEWRDGSWIAPTARLARLASRLRRRGGGAGSGGPPGRGGRRLPHCRGCVPRGRDPLGGRERRAGRGRPRLCDRRPSPGRRPRPRRPRRRPRVRRRRARPRHVRPLTGRGPGPSERPGPHDPPC
jgi:dTDP-glucose pyrophosphorylase